MRKLLVLVALCVLLTISPASAQDSKILTWAFPADSTTFNTILQTENVDSQFQGFIFPFLFMNDLETGMPTPYLATWEESEDGLTYTFHINEDAVWSDGVPISATDVAFTIGATTSEVVGGFRHVNNLEAVNIIDEKTLEVVLSNVNCNWFTDLNFGILPAHMFADDYSDFADNPFNLEPTVSGGPFVFAERATDEFIRFEANDTFFGGRPYFDQLIAPIMPDPDVRFQALESGQVDYVDRLSADQSDLLAGSTTVTTISYPQNGILMTEFNLSDPENPMPAYDEAGELVDQPSHPILGDVRVRQALAMAWDREDAYFLAGETALPLIGGVAPVLDSIYHHDLEPYAYDPEAALALLAEVGWTDSNGDGILDKDGEPMALELLHLADHSDLAAVMADYWGDIGVDITLGTGEQGAILGERAGGQNFDMLIIGASWDAPTPDILLNFLFDSHNDFGTNFPSYVNQDFDNLMAELATAGCSIEERLPLYLAVQETMHETLPADFLHTRGSRIGVNSRLNGVEVTAWGSTPIWTWTAAE